jgi:hypothetical protein
VAAGDDDDRGPSCCSRRASSSGGTSSSLRVSARASGTFGVTTVARGRIRSMSARSASGGQQPRAGLGDHHGVDDDRRALGQRVEARATASMTGASPSIPIFTASTPRSLATARICSATNAGGTGARR